MLMSRGDCLRRYGSDYLTAQQIKAGQLFQIEKGVYSDQERVPEQAVIAFKYPKAIMTMTSAFYHHGLTDVIPDKFDLATDRDAAKIRDSRVHQYFMPHDFCEDGAELADAQGYPIRVYNRERMLIELLRNKATIPFDLYKEILLNYRKILPQLDIQKIQDYAMASPKSNMVMNALQMEVM